MKYRVELIKKTRYVGEVGADSEESAIAFFQDLVSDSEGGYDVFELGPDAKVTEIK
jgi:hypothetical protein